LVALHFMLSASIDDRLSKCSEDYYVLAEAGDSVEDIQSGVTPALASLAPSWLVPC
jgi:hypothetical protein